MLKRLLLIAFLALNIFAISHTTAYSPAPECFPCPDEVR